MQSCEYFTMKSLILGGTGFIGRRLVADQIKSGNEVTMVTSGNSPNPFEDKVNLLKGDRFNRERLKEVFSGTGYQDVIFDTIGYRSMDVKNALDAVGENAGRYVYISSASVYDGMEGILDEKSYNSSGIDARADLENNYADGKRLSEAFLLKHSPMPVSIVRFPIVIGHDDSTLRFQKNISQIVKGEEFYFQEPQGKRNYVWVEDAGRFLSWLAGKKVDGIFNAASPEALKPSELIGKMARSIGKEAIIKLGEEESDSSYSASGIRILNVEKASKNGFSFTPTDQWIIEESVKARDNGIFASNSMSYTRGLFSK